MHHTPFKFLKLSTAFILFVTIYSCQQKEVALSDTYLKEDAEFRTRLSKGRDHYLKLVGLHALIQGTNIFGGAEENNIQLESDGIPATIGAIEITDNRVILTVADSLEVRLLENDSAISSWTYEFVESSANAPMMKYNHLEWQVIKRAEDYFLRVKDQNSEQAKYFKGFQAYPLQSSYVVEAEYEPFESIKTEEVNTQLGTNQQMDMVGKLAFQLEGENYQLSVGASGFLIVGDQTNDNTTYGGGRYVYVDLPESAGKITIDFNRLYNPPCVYSEFTTCPLPPSQNILPVKILAGEKHMRL